MNFLFLSKLLPLFVYPLGLASTLLVIALGLKFMRKRARGSKKKIYSQLSSLSMVLALVVLWLGSNGWVSNYLVASLEWQNIPKNIPQAEAIVLLGGATKPPSYPRSMPDISEKGDRIIYSAKLYKYGKAPLIIAAGGRISWRRGGGGQSEAEDMQQLLEFIGVPAEAIIQEPNSLNTHENAVNVKKILKKKGIKKILLVTSAIHMPRSLLIFKKQEIDAIAAPTDFLISRKNLNGLTSSTQSIVLNLIPNAHHLEKTTRSLKEYIGMFVYRLKGWL